MDLFCLALFAFGIIIGIIIATFFPFRTKARNESNTEYQRKIKELSDKAVKDYAHKHLENVLTCTMVNKNGIYRFTNDTNEIYIQLDGIDYNKRVNTKVIETNGKWNFSLTPYR